MKRKDRRHIATLLSAALMMAGTSLWCGCSSEEQLTDKTPGMEVPEQANDGSFTFHLNGVGTQNRAATTEAETAEKEIKTLYVAFFYKDEADEAASRLQTIFVYDDAVTGEGGFNEDRKITKAAGTGGNPDSYTIAKPGYVGSYITYFIANPDADMKTKLGEFQASAEQARTTLGTFEGTLVTKKASVTTTDGLIMVSDKQSIEVNESNPASEIILTRLAARFDLVNTQPTMAQIKTVKFINEPIQATVVPQETLTATEYLQNVAAVNWKATSENTMTSYTYENLNTKGVNDKYTAIEITYVLDTNGTSSFTGQEKTLLIELKEQDVPLAVLRNHLYRIYLNCVTGLYTLTVEDWIAGSTVTIPNSDLAITYTADDLGKIGDYVYNNNGTLNFSDGGLRKMYLDGSLEWIWEEGYNGNRPAPVANKGTCVGVVFSNMTSDKDKKMGYTRGYAMVAKAAPSAQWHTTSDSYSVEYSATDKMSVLASNMDGLTLYREIKKKGFSSLPAFSSMENLITQAQDGSECYIPTVGQWLVLLRNLGGVSTNAINSNYTFSDSSTFRLDKTPQVITNNLNSRINSIEGHTDFSNGWVWSCSEFNGNKAYSISLSISASQSFFNSYQKNDNSSNVRAIFAF